MVTRATLAKAIRRLRLQRFEATLTALARPALRIRTEPCADRDIPIGASKFGGQPDLPDGVEWPSREGAPLSFIAQFDCRELHQFEAGALLPPDGLLSFFYDAEEQPWGFDPADAGAARVLYHPASAGFARRRYPPPEIAADDEDEFDSPEFFSAKRVEFREILRLPSHFDYHDEAGVREFWNPSDGLAIDPDELDRMTRLFDPRNDRSEHQLFGYPTVIQNPMELECELVSHGINTGNGYPPDAVARWGAGAASWRLLLQVDSADDIMWGDTGIIYYWITEDALRAREFDRAWLILQCS